MKKLDDYQKWQRKGMLIDFLITCSGSITGLLIGGVLIRIFGLF